MRLDDTNYCPRFAAHGGLVITVAVIAAVAVAADTAASITLNGALTPTQRQPTGTVIMQAAGRSLEAQST